jgi:hypothetical protein
MATSAIVGACVFVDWNSQTHNFSPRTNDIRLRAKRTLVEIGRTVGSYLATHKSLRFTVSLRLYAGWHRGVTPTDMRRILPAVVGSALDEAQGEFRNVSFPREVSFGDRLLAALESRLVHNAHIHLPDTLRQDRANTGREREKMVDTAMVADIVAHARSRPGEWRIVLSEDDDVAPAIFVAEYWTESEKNCGATIVLRKNEPNKHLNARGLFVTLPGVR